MPKILVSSCLLGQPCRYNGTHSLNKTVVEFCSDKNVLLACPEVLGGLPTPRLPAEIHRGDGNRVLNGEGVVFNKLGVDVSGFFLLGAIKTYKLTKVNNIRLALLKSKSPSCGSRTIYSGKFNGELKTGDGVTAALLKENKVKVIAEEDI
ncbi:DUF523 domain-containing protein [Proteinivorax tanatarense]|uniref:DUF523 domain-containing protein n=1 Tax=Proteinivorax tanatarense TaxID=1260629 RepID=A0AAU7VNM7_9FIRM